MKENKLPKPDRGNHLLDSKVALIKHGNDSGHQNFKISYDYYNDNLCEIDDLEISCARKCLTKLVHLGKSNCKTLHEKNLKPKPVVEKGEYKKLFSKLSPDVTVFELTIGAKSRMFYFITENIVHIISIKNSHFNIH